MNIEKWIMNIENKEIFFSKFMNGFYKMKIKLQIFKDDLWILENNSLILNPLFPAIAE